jgi:hypothetical protein
MKNIKNVSLWSLLVFATVFVLTACSDDDYSTNNEDGAYASIEKSEEQILDTLCYKSLISQLCEVKELPDGRVSYTPHYGEALHVATPTIYYVGIDTLTQARCTWQGVTSAVRDSASAQTRINEVSVLNMHLSYSEGDNENELARIDVDCPELANVLTSIVFIPIDRWPSNDQGSPFGFLSVWQEEKTHYYYLCVRKSVGGEGILLTFDGGYTTDWLSEYPKWQGRFYLWGNTASTDAIESLSYCMHFTPTKFNAAITKLKEEAPASKTCSILSDLQRDIYSHTFDHSYGYYHYLWKFYNCYYVSILRSCLQKDGKCSTWSNSFRRDNTPTRETPSHSIKFNSDYSNKTGWNSIFKGS